jgi:L-iditol 2-dehydrogenase
MRVAKYYRQDDIRIEKMPKPRISDDEALIAMRACGICGSDLMDWYLKDRVPLVLGHEPAGIVADRGSKVSNFEVGNRVFVHHHVPCLKCYYCLRGDFTLCNQFHETNIKPGGFAEYFIVPAPNLKLDTMKIPKALSFEEATLIEPIGCCLRALKKCNIQKEDTVVVIGAGATGILNAALAKILGAEKTIISDFVEFRLNVARRFGADIAVDPRRENLAQLVRGETDERGADIAVVAAPSLQAYETGLNICRKGGRLCLFAPTSPEKCLLISPKELFFKEIQIVPSYSASHLETREALDLLASGKLNVKDLITHCFKLADAAKAFKTALESRESLKVVITNE